MPDLNLLFDYESGVLNDDDFLTLFQQIFDTKAYQWLQGHYGRTLETLVAEGLIK